MTHYLVDSHAHLDDSRFDADREAVIDRARAAGLRYLLAVGGGTGPEKLDGSIAIAERHDWIYAGVGFHPHDARHFTKSHLERLRELAAHPKVVAIGEIGLDYYYDHSPRDIQKQVLIQQLELAREARLPVVIHCRDAWPDLRELIAAHWSSTGLGGVLHCFSGSREDALAFMDGGFLVSFAGNLTFAKAENLRRIAREIPLDRLLTETDCPYLAPIPYRGKRNEPAYVREVTQALGELHNLSEEEMGQKITSKFRTLFDLS